MSTHVTWALVGFGIALLFTWVHHMLKKRGFKFFWYHPLFTGLFLLFILYLLERIFADLSDIEVQESWNMLTYLGIPLAAARVGFLDEVGAAHGVLWQELPVEYKPADLVSAWDAIAADPAA